MDVRTRSALVAVALSLAALLGAAPACAQPHIRCCDGTRSPTCTTPHRGCCSHHGGVCETDAPERGAPPRITDSPVVASALPPAVIRQVAMAHLAEVRACHELGLITHANAAGRVLVRFVIGSDGRVIESVVANRTYPVQGVAECIARAVARWVFPAPAGGVVVVNYPFNLLAEENAASEPPPARAPARPRPNRGRSR